MERIIAEDVRTDDEGNVLGDRVRVVAQGDHVNLYREWMPSPRRSRVDGPGSHHAGGVMGQHHAKEEDKSMDWDWKVDPDAGLCLSHADARELLSALSEVLK